MYIVFCRTREITAVDPLIEQSNLRWASSCAEEMWGEHCSRARARACVRACVRASERASEGGGQEGGAGLVGDFLEALRHDGDGGSIICVDQVRDFQAARELVSAKLRNEMSELAVPVEGTKNTASCIGLSPTQQGGAHRAVPCRVLSS